MEWKVIAENYIGALVGFIIYFVPMLLAHCVFDQTGRIRLGFLFLHCAIFVLLFLGATFRASSKLEEIAREFIISTEEKEALSPKLNVSFSPLFDDPSYARYKYPLYEYCFLVGNRNKQSVPITDLTINIFFKNIINELTREVMTETGGIIIGGMRYIEKEGQHRTIIEDKPLDIPTSRAIVLTVRTRRNNGGILNTNEAVLNSEKWPKGASMEARVVIDVTAKPDLISKPDKMGTYEGKYYYQIKNKEFEGRLSGLIPDPNITLLLAEFYYERGLAYEKKEQYDEAIAEYVHVIEYDSNHTNTYFHRGLCYLKKKDHSAAILENNRVIELNPNYADAYFNRGSAYAESKKYDEAIEDYNKYIRMKPQDPEGYITRGRVLGSKGENDEAISDYNKALELNPNMQDEIYYKLWIVYNNRGVSLAKEDKHSEAVADFSKAIQLNPNDGQSYYNRSRSWLHLGDKEKAITDMKKACDLGIKKACDEYEKLIHN